MKAPLVVIILIVVAMLGFLTFYSQQREVTTQAQHGQSAGYSESTPAAAGTSGAASAPAGGSGQ